MTPARVLLSRLLAASALVLPAACGDDAPSAASDTTKPAAGSGGMAGSPGGAAGASTGGVGGVGGSGVGGTAPCNPPPTPEPTTQELCYAPQAIDPGRLGFCRRDAGAVQVSCNNADELYFATFPAESPCNGKVTRLCPGGAKTLPTSPWTDPCAPPPVGTGGFGAGGKGTPGDGGSGGAGAGTGATGGTGGGGAGAGTGATGGTGGGGAGAGGAGAGGAGTAGAGGGGAGAETSGGGAGAAGTAGQGGAPPAAVCVQTATSDLDMPGVDAATFLRCIGIDVPSAPSSGPGFGAGGMVRVGPVVASTENGAAKCCHVATTTFQGYLCGRPLLQESTPVVADLVRVGTWV